MKLFDADLLSQAAMFSSSLLVVHYGLVKTSEEVLQNCMWLGQRAYRAYPCCGGFVHATQTASSNEDLNQIELRS